MFSTVFGKHDRLDARLRGLYSVLAGPAGPAVRDAICDSPIELIASLTSSAGVLAVAAALLAAAAIGAARPPRRRRASARCSSAPSTSKGEPVDGLGPDAFVVREDGAPPRSAARVARHRADRHRAARRQQRPPPTTITVPARARCRSSSPTMAPGNQIALIGLADRPTILVDYTERPEAARRRRRTPVRDAAERHDAARRHRRDCRRGCAARDAARRHRRRSSPTASSSPTATPATSSRRCVEAQRRAARGDHRQLLRIPTEHEHPRALVPARRRPARTRRPAAHAADADGPRPGRCRSWRASCRRSTRSSTAGRSRSSRPRRSRSSSARARVTMRGAPARGETEPDVTRRCLAVVARSGSSLATAHRSAAAGSRRRRRPPADPRTPAIAGPPSAPASTSSRSTSP